jgi:hypothetical protein
MAGVSQTSCAILTADRASSKQVNLNVKFGGIVKRAI